jgi:hypothetical protein
MSMGRVSSSSYPTSLAGINSRSTVMHRRSTSLFASLSTCCTLVTQLTALEEVLIRDGVANSSTL